MKNKAQGKMTLKKRIRRVVIVFYKLFNTLCFLFSKKDEILVVNGSFFQLNRKIIHYNIGDDLNYYLLGALSGKKILSYGLFFHFGKPITNLMAIGSIIDWMGNNNALVWGSGILFPPVKSDANIQYNIGKVFAVRGKLTRECLLNSGIDCPEVYGDPALLLPYVYMPQVKKVKNRIGFIPHYKDTKNKDIVRLIRECGNNALLIKVQEYTNWKALIMEILSCEYVISSSLHGLIISDAYGIPNLWITLKKALPGGTFKFEDYYSSIGKEPIAYYVTEETSITTLLEKKDHYKFINYDPRPLLQACPFTITNPNVLKLLE